MKNSVSPQERLPVWLSLLGGSIAGLISVRVALWSALTHQPMDPHTRLAGHVTGFLLGDFLLPVVLALVARRRYFLWACLAVGIKLFWTLTDRIVTGNGPGFLHDLVGNGHNDLLSLLWFAGPVSLFRFLLVWNRDRNAAREAIIMRTAVPAPPPQEGVWPPPPTKPTDP